MPRGEVLKGKPELARKLAAKGGRNKRKYFFTIICNKCNKDVTKEGIPAHYRAEHPEVYRKDKNGKRV